MRRVTVVISPGALNSSELLQFPQATPDVLGHARNGSSIAEIVRDFEERDVRMGKYTPDQVVNAAIDLLEARKLIRVIQPESAADQTDSRAKLRTRERGDQSPGNAVPAVSGASRIAANSPFQIVDNAACR